MNAVKQERKGDFAILNAKDETIKPWTFNSTQLRLVKSSREHYMCVQFPQ